MVLAPSMLGRTARLPGRHAGSRQGAAKADWYTSCLEKGKGKPLSRPKAGGPRGLRGHTGLVADTHR